MNNLVDLTNLREMTDGDHEMERALFDEFSRSSHECLKAMRESIPAYDDEQWRANAHAIKGTALNLGAAYLGQLCKDAEDNSAASNDVKLGLLNKISDALKDVEVFLANEQ